MQKVLQGIKNYEVILLEGDDLRGLLQEYVYCKYPHETFSAINMNMESVAASLSSKRWDGTCPIVVFYRCEAKIKEISRLIRERQPKQAVILVSDGVYTSHTPLLKSLATRRVVVGHMPRTIFSLLKGGSQCYKEAIESTNVNNVIDQIHNTNEDFDVSCSLSDCDILRYNVPEDLLVDCLPPVKSIEFKSNRPTETKIASNIKFAKTLVPIVARTTLSLRNMHETMEYIRYAHDVNPCPNIAQYPRDNDAEHVVHQINEKIRVLTDNTPKRGLQNTMSYPRKVHRIN
jgi:hypothetical protein